MDERDKLLEEINRWLAQSEATLRRWQQSLDEHESFVRKVEELFAKNQT